MRAAIRTIVVVVAAICAGGCGTQPEDSIPGQLERVAPDPPLRGIDASTGLAALPVDVLVEDLDRAAALGVNAVRVPVFWSWLEPEAGGLDPTRAEKVDTLLTAARKQGVGVVLLPFFTPCWASTLPLGPVGECNPEHVLYPPQDPASYGAFVGRLVDRWGAGLSGLEVWNEPNNQGFWRGSPFQYVELVEAAAEAVDATAYSDLPVVGGATSGADLDYLRQLFDLGISQWTDAISIHPYDARWSGVGFGDPAIARPGDQSSFAYAVPQVHELMVAYSDPDPIWITEFGYPDCPATPYCVSAQDQAEYLRSAAGLAADWPFVDAFLVYRLRDWLPQDGGIEARFGVLNEDGSRKPAADALADVFEEFARSWDTPRQ